LGELPEWRFRPSLDPNSSSLAMAAEAKSTKGDLAQGTTADPGDPGDPGAVTQTARAAKYS